MTTDPDKIMGADTPARSEARSPDRLEPSGGWRPMALRIGARVEFNGRPGTIVYVGKSEWGFSVNVHFDDGAPGWWARIHGEDLLRLTLLPSPPDLSGGLAHYGEHRNEPNPPPSPDLREQVARIIAPFEFGCVERWAEADRAKGIDEFTIARRSANTFSEERERAIAKADAILALVSTAGERGR